MIYYYVKLTRNRIVLYKSTNELLLGSMSADIIWGVCFLNKELQEYDELTEEELIKELNAETRKK